MTPPLPCMVPHDGWCDISCIRRAVTAHLQVKP